LDEELKGYLNRKVIDGGTSKRLGDLELSEQKMILSEIFQRPDLAMQLSGAGAKPDQELATEGEEKETIEEVLERVNQSILSDKSLFESESKIIEDDTVLFRGTEEEAMRYADLFGIDILPF
jgi:hypothetical protein